MIADPAGALFWPEERLLIVADLHLEKGSAFAARRVFLPPYDTAATLAALAGLVAAYRPRTVAALGDSFHDVRAGERLGAEDRGRIRALQAGRAWIWIAGNHDRDLPNGLEGETCRELYIGEIVLRHEPRPGQSVGEIAGHLHPVARVAGRAGSVRRRSFLCDGERCVLPAFGAFAGGLNIHDSAFSPLFGRGGAGDDVIAHVMGHDEVYAVPRRRCLPD
ncbi:ligase-associated DNA damage response endonuclease PdeM [Methylocapsa acidiphila]|uniref:ligase-associated DNA damage response endonuclease PdeM n=1 Tax=Methylocapsa acidiphila TaxID=133552 RepID=UPI0004204B88|nr:ligase-associated DNA damage response endonuclease PdeM [Methylocapsa acidiphila]